MQYILLNITLKSSSILEDLMDNKILKEIAYGAKYKEPTLEYDNILLPILENPDFSETDYILNKDYIKQFISNFNNSETILYSIYKQLGQVIKSENSSMVVLGSVLDDTDIDIFYTDGSFSKNQDDAAYACCQLLEEAPNGLIDDFTGKKFLYNAYSGKISEGTNNIGELTGIKVAIENFGSKKYQLIISDSIYGIKSYREYVHTWKKNGWLAYNKKPIKNKELIIETYGEMKEKQNEKIVLLKWTKGHNKNSFNEKCDELAKKELNL